MQVESKRIETVPIADEFGRYLVGRGIGAEIRRRFFSGDPSTWPSTLDFEGVEQATVSCFDEIFGGLAKTYDLEKLRKINIQSATRAVQDVINYVLEILQDPPTRSNAESVLGLLTASRRRSQASRHKGNRSGRPSRTKS